MDIHLLDRVAWALNPLQYFRHISVSMSALVDSASIADACHIVVVIYYDLVCGSDAAPTCWDWNREEEEFEDSPKT